MASSVDIPTYRRRGGTAVPAPRGRARHICPNTRGSLCGSHRPMYLRAARSHRELRSVFVLRAFHGHHQAQVALAFGPTLTPGPTSRLRRRAGRPGSERARARWCPFPSPGQAPLSGLTDAERGRCRVAVLWEVSHTLFLPRYSNSKMEPRVSIREEEGTSSAVERRARQASSGDHLECRPNAEFRHARREATVQSIRKRELAECRFVAV
jgi:hypothetical protein